MASAPFSAVGAASALSARSRFSQNQQLGRSQLFPPSSDSTKSSGFRRSPFARPAFAQKLTPLQVSKHHEAYLHVEYTFNPGAIDSIEPVTFTVSTPLPPGTPLDRPVDPEFREKFVEELHKNFNLPSPERDYVSIHVDIKRHPYAHLQVGDRWQEIQGSQNWNGLIDDKMDPVMRGELIRYGEFAQATYDAFENDPDSKHCGDAKFDKKKLLNELGLENRGYEIIEYIYATASNPMPKFFQKSSVKDENKWSKDSNFMGFVAVCNSPSEIARLGRRDIIVAWRGTVTRLEWMEDVKDIMTPSGLDERVKSEVMVESGFLDVYKSSNPNSRFNQLSAREQVLGAIKKLVRKYKKEELSITVTGHSLGSALSMLCAYDIAESGINKKEHSPRVPQYWNDLSTIDPEHDKEPLDARVPVSVFSFAGPRVGNAAFKDRVEELGVKVLRVVNVHDLVPKVPGIIFNEKLQWLHEMASWLPCSYVHIGRNLEFDTNISDFLRDTTDPVDAHNLEAYLHMLDGYQGPNAPFSPEIKRDIALVNKFSDFLEHKFGIPPNWWEQQMMVKDPKTDRWVVRETAAKFA